MSIRSLLGPLLLLCQVLGAQPEEHRIERSKKECLERATSPGVMAECSRKAATDWDAEVDRLYQELSARLDSEARGALKAAQADWVRFARSEQAAIQRIYSRLKVAAATFMAAEDGLQITRERARELEKYLELTKDQ